MVVIVLMVLGIFLAMAYAYSGRSPIMGMIVGIGLPVLINYFFKNILLGAGITFVWGCLVFFLRKK